MNDMKFLVDLINNGVPIVFGSIDQKHHNSKTKKWWFLITTIINTAILLTIARRNYKCLYADTGTNCRVNNGGGGGGGEGGVWSKSKIST